jgi:hypothetical protein
MAKKRRPRKFSLKDVNRPRQAEPVATTSEKNVHHVQKSIIARRRERGYTRQTAKLYEKRLKQKYGRTTETGWNYQNSYIVVVQEEETGKTQIYPVLTRQQYRTLEDADKGATGEIRDIIENQKEQASHPSRGKYPEGDVVSIERRIEVVPRSTNFSRRFRKNRYPRGTFSPQRKRRPEWYRLPLSKQAPGIPRK